MSFNFEGQVAIVTGAGNGLGKCHAIELAKRGAKVVINDLGGADGNEQSSKAAIDVVNQITSDGGEAFAHGANVANYDEVQDMVNQAVDKWGRVDVLINNAGILRDKSFAKMELSDFRLVLDVHLMGSVNCSKAVWDVMRSQNYGRILMTTSSSGLYGNFGQSNYGTAKMALIGLMNTLALEGQKNNIKVNALSPVAGTKMTESVLPKEIFDMLKVEAVTAGALTLCHNDAPSRMILCAGAGGYARSQVFETDGIYLAASDQTPEKVLSQWEEICDTSGNIDYESGSQQTEKFLAKAKEYMDAQK